MGAVIGHELAHSLDTAGMNIDKTGNVGKNLTLAMQNQFNSRKNCFLNQYSNYKLKDINIGVSITNFCPIDSYFSVGYTIL